jgi:hypothetical protein
MQKKLPIICFMNSISKGNLAIIGLAIITITIAVIVIDNFSGIYAANLYLYKPCVSSYELSQTKLVTSTQTPIPYPNTVSQDSLTLAYPGISIPTITPIICTCQNQWETIKFPFYSLKYPEEAFSSADIDSSSVSLIIPNCHGYRHNGFITFQVVDNNENYGLGNYVAQYYSRAQDYKYREITIDGIRSIEVYEATYLHGYKTYDRYVFMPYTGRIVVGSLVVSARRRIPGSEGKIPIFKPSLKALGFFHMILDNVEIGESS